MKAIAIAARVAEILQDYDTTNNIPASVTWTEDQLIEWVNDAQRAAALVRPDCTATTGNITLVDGTKQSLPAGGLRLLSVVRNMGAGGTTPGRAIIGPVARELKEGFNPDWHADIANAVTKEYLFDDRAPTTFWVSPPGIAGQKIEAVWSKAPTDITILDNEASDPDENDLLTVSDVYAPALIEWMLYRCFARDSETTPNYARAGNHYRNFFNLLGVKFQSDRFASPKVRSEQVETERPTG